MPSRTIDYTAMWTSQKLRNCSIVARREYPWIYGLADVNGSFETTNARALWMQVAPIRPDLTEELLYKILHEYRDNGVLFTWEVRGKAFAHWTGSDKPGRLPRPSQRKRYRWLAPTVPKKALRLYVNRFASKQIRGDVDTRLERASVPPSDSGSKGKGKGKYKASRVPLDASFTPATQAAASSGVSVQFAFKGKRLLVSTVHHKLLDETFGHAFDLQQIYVEADLWLVQTSKRRPNVLKFLSNWCKKELLKTTQQHGGGYPTSKEAVVGRGPQSEGPPGKCQECEREIPPGFVRCYACAEGGNP